VRVIAQECPSGARFHTHVLVGCSPSPAGSC
jgi:hypothetical protein